MFLHFLKMLAPLAALLEIACASDGRALREVVPLFEERGARGGPDEAERLVPIRLNREAMVEPGCRLPGLWDHWFAMRMGPVGLPATGRVDGD
jgi:hypothetical protein